MSGLHFAKELGDVLKALSRGVATGSRQKGPLAQMVRRFDAFLKLRNAPSQPPSFS